MKFDLRLRAGDDVRMVWLLAFSVVLFGALYIQTRYQTAIASSHARTEMLYRRTVAEARIVRESAALRVIEDRAQTDLARVSRDTSLSGTTASLLSMLQSSAKAFGARVLEVRPGDSQDDRERLRAEPVTIRVQGKFRGILAFVEDLSHHGTLISVSDTEMNVAGDTPGRGPEPRLDARIHAVMYRLSMPSDRELLDASGG